MRRVKDLSTMIYFFFLFSSVKRVKLPVKPRQGNKELNLPVKYNKKPILEEVLNGFRVLKQRG